MCRLQSDPDLIEILQQRTVCRVIYLSLSHSAPLTLTQSTGAPVVSVMRCKRDEVAQK